eukprot:GFUD01017781.1.p1 GENE.GFUD01017781.1~~GFUD01017781.1.p1  ORF type:complete len:216 (+),score=65.45 GFUD01017781.1:28-675(+)
MAGSIFNIWIQHDENDKDEKEEEADENDEDAGEKDEDGNEKEENQNKQSNFVSISLLERVELVLKQHKIKFTNKAGSSSKEDKILIQIFVPEDIVEDILLGLQKTGLGAEENSGVSVIPTIVNYFAEEQREETGRVTSVEDSSAGHTKEDHIDKFYNSIRSRLVVAEVIKRIEGGAQFSFDYVCLVVVAALLAFLGQNCKTISLEIRCLDKLMKW